MDVTVLAVVMLLISVIGIATAGPTYQTISDAEVVWEKPGTSKAVLFVAHGCNHGAIDFWPQSPDCPKCIGLPEEWNITERALARGYMVVAISSADRNNSRCWHAGHMHHRAATEDNWLKPTTDILQVTAALKQLRQELQLEQLPVYALGASSGGAFVLALPFHMKIAGVCAQISSFPAVAFRHMLNETKKKDPGFAYPATMFVHMPRDDFTASHIYRLTKVMSKERVEITEVPVLPQLVTTEYLTAKLKIEKSKADKIILALRSAQVIDSQGFVGMDPRIADWRQVVTKDPELQDMPLRADASPLSEVLNLAFAGHEIVSDTTDQVLDWWELRGVGNEHTNRSSTALN